MKNLFNTKFLSVVITLLVLIVIAKIISLVLWWYLPNDGVELNMKKSYRIGYQRVDFKNMLESSSTDTKKTKEIKHNNYANINNMVLHGLYGNNKNGFAIVSKKSTPDKTKIVAISEIYEGYKLKDILIKSVIFTRGSKEYTLKLTQSKNLKESVDYVEDAKTQEDSNEYLVKKKDIRFYSKNPTKIWRDISISEHKHNGKLIGFKVNRIRKNSKMSKIGLEVGDIIIRANNVDLKSYRDAMKLYKDIDKIDVLDLVVLRDNEEKEIIYEIN